MPDLKQFPTDKTLVGTLMAIGWTPKDTTSNELIAFATFDSNGRLESYIIQTKVDYDLLLDHLTDKVIWGEPVIKNDRKDIQISSNQGKNIILH